MPLTPGPLIPAPLPRRIETARDLIAWVVRQDATNCQLADPVSVPSEAMPWLTSTLERRNKRGLN